MKKPLLNKYNYVFAKAKCNIVSAVHFTPMVWDHSPTCLNNWYPYQWQCNLLQQLPLFCHLRQTLLEIPPAWIGFWSRVNWTEISPLEWEIILDSLCWDLFHTFVKFRPIKHCSPSWVNPDMEIVCYLQRWFETHSAFSSGVGCSPSASMNLTISSLPLGTLMLRLHPSSDRLNWNISINSWKRMLACLGTWIGFLAVQQTAQYVTLSLNDWMNEWMTHWHIFSYHSYHMSQKS